MIKYLAHLESSRPTYILCGKLELPTDYLLLWNYGKIHSWRSCNATLENYFHTPDRSSLWSRTHNNLFLFISLIAPACCIGRPPGPAILSLQPCWEYSRIHPYRPRVSLLSGTTTLCKIAEAPYPYAALGVRPLFPSFIGTTGECAVGGWAASFDGCGWCGYEEEWTLEAQLKWRNV